jgi:hypothetical protein
VGLSTGVPNSHGWQTYAHALIEHPNVMVESIIGGGFDFKFVPRPIRNEFLPSCLIYRLHLQLLRPWSSVASLILVTPNK